jgi:hypothetical protein
MERESVSEREIDRAAARRGLIVVSLLCGDQITVRNPPLSDKAKYACRAGAEHSYNQAWVSYRTYGSTITHDNPLVVPDQQAD